MEKIILEEKQFKLPHPCYVTPTPLPRLSFVTGLAGRPRQVENPSWTRCEMVWRF